MNNKYVKAEEWRKAEEIPDGKYYTSRTKDWSKIKEVGVFIGTRAKIKM